jgi:NAD(P)-dependent dehydrogenase (short-subunit alcohol dehydrogenase family)
VSTRLARVSRDHGDELAPAGITVRTINPGPYDTGLNDRMADTTYRGHDDAVDVTCEDDIKASFAAIMKGQFDPPGDD